MLDGAGISALFCKGRENQHAACIEGRFPFFGNAHVADFAGSVKFIENALKGSIAELLVEFGYKIIGLEGVVGDALVYNTQLWRDGRSIFWDAEPRALAM